MAAILAILAAVAGGNLGVTATPAHPRVGHRVVVGATGQVGTTGRLYLYRSARSCADTARGERRLGTLLATRPIKGSFEALVSYRPRRVRTEWICGYLYAISCDIGDQGCAPATGLPPDAGFDQVRVRVRPASQSAKSPAARGRVIT